MLSLTWCPFIYMIRLSFTYICLFVYISLSCSLILVELLWWQVAGLPTNIDFLSRLAKHHAFKDGNVETHFIENYKDDLFIDPTDSILAKEAHDGAKHYAVLVAACICEKENRNSQESVPGNSRSFLFWLIWCYMLKFVLKVSYLYLQEWMDYFRYGMPTLPLEWTTSLSVRWSWSGIPSTIAVAQSFWTFLSHIRQMGNT